MSDAEIRSACMSVEVEGAKRDALHSLADCESAIAEMRRAIETGGPCLSTAEPVRSMALAWSAVQVLIALRRAVATMEGER